jgi:hypothetical protein
VNDLWRGELFNAVNMAARADSIARYFGPGRSIAHLRGGINRRILLSEGDAR